MNQTPSTPDSASTAPATSTALPRPLPPIYYHPGALKDFYIPNGAATGYVQVRQSVAEKLLVAAGYKTSLHSGELLSEVDETILRIQTEQAVSYVNDLAGYTAGFYPEFKALVTSSPHFVEPRPGDWPVLKKLMENLFGPQQIPYVLGWIKRSLEQYRMRKWLIGQAFIMCGPAGSGKNLFRILLSILFGGERRIGHPYKWMTGATSFNSDLCKGETLVIEDEAASKKSGARVAFGASIKGLIANHDQWFHQKYAEASSVTPLWRLVISVNDDPECLLVLPLVTEDIMDKLMIFKVEKHPMPMLTATAEEMEAFKAKLVSELPAFVDFLEKWTIPSGLVSQRFGVTHFHHPDIIHALEQTTPEYKLLDMIDEVLFSHPLYDKDWEGGSEDLARELKSQGSPCAYEARKLLEHTNSAGTYLGRLSRKKSSRISSRIVNGRTIWTIKKPLGLAPEPRVSPAFMQKLLNAPKTINPSSPEAPEAPAAA